MSLFLRHAAADAATRSNRNTAQRIRRRASVEISPPTGCRTTGVLTARLLLRKHGYRQATNQPALQPD